MIRVQVWHWVLEMDQYLWPFVALKRGRKSGCGVELWRAFSKLSHPSITWSQFRTLKKKHQLGDRKHHDPNGQNRVLHRPSKRKAVPERTAIRSGQDCQVCPVRFAMSWFHLLEFLRHWKQHTLIPCECGESLDPKDFAEHMKKHERQTKLPTSETPELIPCEICGDFFLPAEYTEHWKGHEAKTSMSDLSNYTTPSAMAARWVEHLRCEAETQNLPASCIIVNFDLAVSFAERALRETWDGKDVWFVFLENMTMLIWGRKL